MPRASIAVLRYFEVLPPMILRRAPDAERMLHMAPSLFIYAMIAATRFTLRGAAMRDAPLTSLFIYAAMLAYFSTRF